MKIQNLKDFFRAFYTVIGSEEYGAIYGEKWKFRVDG